jgi:hypothetical protein
LPEYFILSVFPNILLESGEYLVKFAGSGMKLNPVGFLRARQILDLLPANTLPDALTPTIDSLSERLRQRIVVVINPEYHRIIGYYCQSEFESETALNCPK